VTELEVGRELKCLCHGNVTPGLEHHHSNWASWKHVSDNEFGNDIQANLLVSDGLDHTNGDDVEEGNDQGKDESPDRKTGVPNFNGNDTKHEHGDENDRVPPFGDLLVLAHEAGVDIWLFTHGATGLDPNLLTVIEEGVSEGGSDGSEGETVSDSECSREVQGRISFIFRFIE